MPTAAEMRRMEHLMGIIIPLVTGRVLGEKDPQPGWLPRRLVTVVSGDVDVDARVRRGLAGVASLVLESGDVCRAGGAPRRRVRPLMGATGVVGGGAVLDGGTSGRRAGRRRVAQGRWA